MIASNWFHAARCTYKTTNEVWDVRYLFQKGDLQPDPLHRVYQMTSRVAFTRMSTAVVLVTMSGCIFPLSAYGLVAFVMFTYHLLKAFRGIKYDGEIGFNMGKLDIGYLIHIPG